MKPTLLFCWTPFNYQVLLRWILKEELPLITCKPKIWESRGFTLRLLKPPTRHKWQYWIRQCVRLRMTRFYIVVNISHEFMHSWLRRSLTFSYPFCCCCFIKTPCTSETGLLAQCRYNLGRDRDHVTLGAPGFEPSMVHVFYKAS